MIEQAMMGCTTDIQLTDFVGLVLADADIAEAGAVVDVPAKIGVDGMVAGEKLRNIMYTYITNINTFIQRFHPLNDRWY